MKTVYCDFDFAFQNTEKVFAAGTSNAVAASIWSATLAGAIALADDGDTIKVASGTYELPGTIEKSVLIAAVGTVRYEYTPPDPIEVVFDNYACVAAGKTVQFQGGEVAAQVGVLGALVLNRVTNVVNGKAFGGGAVVALGINRPLVRIEDGASCQHYPSSGNEGRWPTQFPVSHYRNVGFLEAPAKIRGESGQVKNVWVRIGEFRFVRKAGAAGETSATSVAVATAESTLFARPGTPAHPDMRVVASGITHQITGVLRPNGPGQDVRIGVVAREGMAWGE